MGGLGRGDKDGEGEGGAPEGARPEGVDVVRHVGLAVAEPESAQELVASGVHRLEPVRAPRAVDHVHVLFLKVFKPTLR